MIDVTQRKVTVRGRVDTKKRMQQIRLMAKDKKINTIHRFEELGGEVYSNNDYRERHEPCSSSWKLLKSRDCNRMIKRACCLRCALSWKAYDQMTIISWNPVCSNDDYLYSFKAARQLI